jgi:polyether ionophore transport system permease protein
MTGLTGTPALIRLAARRDRILLPAWLYVLTGVVASTGYSLKKAYPTAADRAALAAGVGHNPSIAAIYGAAYSSSLGGITAWRIGLIAAAGGSLMSIILVIRHTRGDEEAGRLELVGATAVGRQAAPVAGLSLALAACTVLGLLIMVTCLLLGMPAAGSVALGLEVAAAGWVFAGIAVLCAQLTASARPARGIAASLLGLAYLLRAVGDANPGISWLTWASPLGWAERLRPFAAERWWVLGLSVAVTAGLCALAWALAARRDVGSGLLPARPGRARAAPWLANPLALAWRLQRGWFWGWLAGFALAGIVLGAAAHGIGSLLNSAQVRADVFRYGGHAGLVNAYFVVLFTEAAIVAAAYAVSVTLRLQAEEAEQRADPVLAAPVGRTRWAAGHLLTATVGPAVMLAVVGAGAGVAYGTHGGMGGQVLRLLGAGLAQVPTAWLMVGVAVAVFGLAPRLTVSVSWGALAVAALVSIVGPLLRLNHWVLDLSPFVQAPKLPGTAFTATSLLWLTGVSAVLVGVGLTGLRHRDVG